MNEFNIKDIILVDADGRDRNNSNTETNLQVECIF